MKNRVKVEYKGAKALARQVQAMGREGLVELGRSLFKRGEEIMGDSKEYYVPVAPKDGGTLRSSGHVQPPVRTGANRMSVKLGYGGAAVPYAIVQHERTWYKHTTGQAKYLYTPAMAHAKSMGRKVSGDMAAAIVRAAMKHKGKGA